MSLKLHAVWGTAIAVAIAWSGAAAADNSPRGIWYDHDGRGAVEINDCENGRGLCGYVVHVKEKRNSDRCGMQILGNVTPQGGGWIYSPSRGKKYTVRVSKLNDNRLRVVGNAKSRFFSKTFTWERAPDGIELCGKYANRNTSKSEVATVNRVEERTAEPLPRASEEPKTASRDDEWSAAPAEGAASDETADTGRLERKCKFRIPYVGRVVMVPCRDRR